MFSTAKTPAPPVLGAKVRVIGSAIVQKTTISFVRQQCAVKSYPGTCHFFDNYAEEQRQNPLRMFPFLSRLSCAEKLCALRGCQFHKVHRSQRSQCDAVRSWLFTNLGRPCSGAVEDRRFFSRKISDLASHPLHKVVSVILAHK